MPSTHYNTGLKEMQDGIIDFLNDTIKFMLVGPGYIPNPDHNFLSEGLSANEINISGYVPGFGNSGRKQVQGKSISQNNSANTVSYFCSNPTWAALGSGITVGGIAFIKEITSDSFSRPIVFIDFPDKITDGTDFPIIFASTGFLRLRPLVII